MSNDDAAMDAFIDQLDAVGAAVADAQNAQTDSDWDAANARIVETARKLKEG